MNVERMFPVALLAGGLATRLRPLTEVTPKALIEIAGRPFIDHQLRWLARQKVRNVVICAGHLGEQIRAFVGNGSAWDMTVAYSFDGPQLLGTGGALKQALPLLDEKFFVLYGDSYLPIKYRPVADAFIAAGKPALMTVFKNDGRWDRSNVEFTTGAIRCYDKRSPTAKMRHIDYGLGVLSPAALEGWPADAPFDLADVYAGLAAAGELAGYEVAERFYEIGSSEGMRETAAYLLEKEKA